MARNDARKGLTRRRLTGGAVAGAAALAVGRLATRPALADRPAMEAVLRRLVGERWPLEGKLRLDLPEIAENGNAVPLTVEVRSPMTEQEHVRAIHVLAEANPLPQIVTFRFTPASGKAVASTRIRLARSQTVTALAELSDGSVHIARREVRVTVGGCGG